MPTSSLTSDQIISAALRRIGNETITEVAQVWLNNFLDDLYRDFKWPFLEKSQNGNLAQGATSVNLPADFGDLWDENSLRIIGPDNGVAPLVPMDQDDFDLLTDPDLTGQPQRVLFNYADMTWRPYPVPDKAYSYRLRYKRKPSRVDYEQAADVVDFPNDEILIQGVYVKALQYEDDDRYVPELQVLQRLLANFLGGINRSPTKSNRVRLAPTVFSTPRSFR